MPLARVTGWATDPMTWRDLAWALMTMTIGFVLSLLTSCFCSPWPQA